MFRKYTHFHTRRDGKTFIRMPSHFVRCRFIVARVIAAA